MCCINRFFFIRRILPGFKETCSKMISDYDIIAPNCVLLGVTSLMEAQYIVTSSYANLIQPETFSGKLFGEVRTNIRTHTNFRLELIFVYATIMRNRYLGAKTRAKRPQWKPSLDMNGFHIVNRYEDVILLYYVLLLFIVYPSRI